MKLVGNRVAPISGIKGSDTAGGGGGGGEDLHLADLLFTRNSLFRKKFRETVRFESWFKVHFIH